MSKKYLLLLLFLVYPFQSISQELEPEYLFELNVGLNRIINDVEEDFLQDEEKPKRLVSSIGFQGGSGVSLTGSGGYNCARTNYSSRLRVRWDGSGGMCQSVINVGGERVAYNFEEHQRVIIKFDVSKSYGYVDKFLSTYFGGRLTGWFYAGSPGQDSFGFICSNWRNNDCSGRTKNVASRAVWHMDYYNGTLEIYKNGNLVQTHTGIVQPTGYYNVYARIHAVPTSTPENSFNIYGVEIKVYDE